MAKQNTGKSPVIKERVRKSVRLTASEHKTFKKLVDTYHTKIDAAEALSLHRGTLRNIYNLGSGNPESIRKIKAFISPEPIEA